MELKQSDYNMFIDNKKQESILVNTRTMNKVKFRREEAAFVKKSLAENDFGELKNRGYLNCLLENEFLLPHMYDEHRWIELMYNEMVYDKSYLSVTILPTINCNFKCVYCYENPESLYMSKEVVERVKRFFNKKIPGCKQVKISWFGGEPLLQKEVIFELMEHVNMLCKKYGVALAGTMNTNGYLLDRKTFKRLVSLKIRTYEICVDGPIDTHNRQRPHRELADSYQCIIKNLTDIKKEIKTNTFAIGIRTNVTPELEGVLDEHIRQMSELFSGDDRFYLSFQGVRNWGGERINSEMVLGTVREKKMHSCWHAVATKNRMKSIEAIPIIPFAGYCDATRHNGYVINYDGSLHKCTLAMFNPDSKDIDSIGYIDQYGNPIVDEEKHACWIIKPTPIREQCKKCKLFPVCIDGSCVYQRNILGNYRCNPIMEMLIEQILRFDELGKIIYCDKRYVKEA